MEHKLKPLPYPSDALAPYCSQETMEYHHGKHLKAYIDKMNELIKGTEFEDMPLEEIVKKSSGPLYNNAAQTLNHEFFWPSMKAGGGGEPTGKLADALAKKWGDFKGFRDAYVKSAVANFGAGWTWLVQKPGGELDIVNMGPAGNPITTPDKALLGIDVWEHAYYIDYRNARQKYVETFLDKLVDWDFVAKQLG